MYYYKDIINNCYIALENKTEREDFVQVTKEEYDSYMNVRNIRRRVIELKRNLTNTDYQAIKYAEGLLTEEQYAPIKAQRQAWRDEINQLENETQN